MYSRTVSSSLVARVCAVCVVLMIEQLLTQERGGRYAGQNDTSCSANPRCACASGVGQSHVSGPGAMQVFPKAAAIHHIWLVSLLRQVSRDWSFRLRKACHGLRK